MNASEILKHVDHTQLKAFATWEDIDKLCSEAVALHTASVCVPPCYIKRIRQAYPDLTICTVVGFPLGYSVLEAKEAETKKAIEDGADEVDMVINISDVKNGDYVVFGDVLGNAGTDSIKGTSQISFMVFNKSVPVDPEKAPRG